MNSVKTVADHREEKHFMRAFNEGRADRQTTVYNRGVEARAVHFPEIVAQEGFLGAVHEVYSGEKFTGGWGLDRNYEVVDLPAIRKKSLELWRSNPIAVGIFNRLVTKVVNDGLKVEAMPEAQFIGFDQD